MTLATAPRPPAAAGGPAAVPGSAMVRETAALTAVLCATVPALMPLAERGMAATHDGLLHVQRLIAVEAVVRQGAPFMRWLPDLAYGYGQPLFLYYAPLSYVPGILPRLFGAGYVASFEVASGLALVLSALAMYVLARSLFGLLAASVAAIVYAVLPYQLVDVYVRGALAESWAFVWLPLGAWCLTRAWIDQRPRWSVGLALTVAGLVLTHNVTALLFLPTLVLLALLLQVAGPATWRQAPVRPLVAVALGVALSAWFWLPALAERHLVQIGETIEPDLFASFFVRGWPPFNLEPLFDYQLPVSTALGSPIYWPRLGLVQVAVTIVGAVVALRSTGVQRTVAVWAILLAFGGYLMQLQPLAPLYDLVPLLAFVQFPWRLLALIGLGSAILAGVFVEAVSGKTAIRGAFAVAVVGASLVTALAQLDPEMTPVDERTLSVESIARAELAEYGLGTTHSGEYLPVSSGQRNANRLRRTVMQADGERASGGEPASSALQVERIDWRPDRIQVDVSASAPERLILHQFAFPGWQAWIDGEQAPTSAAGELGLLSVSVPAGQHTVELAWSWTPLRTVATALSVAALLLLAPLASPGRWRPTPRFTLMAVATVGFIASLLAPSWMPPRSGDRLAAERPQTQAVGESLMLTSVSHDLSRLDGERVVVSKLTWLVREAPTTGYRAFVEVTGLDGSVHHRAPWVYEPLSRLWGRGELVPTIVATRIPPDVPGGAYQLQLRFERPESLPSVSLGSIAVPEATRTSPSLSDHDGVMIGSDIRLSAPVDAARIASGPVSARPGGSLDIPLRWEQVGATPNVERELQAVAVLAASRADVVSEPRRPGDWFSPLPFWQRGEVIHQNVRLALPAWLPPGEYPLAVRVYTRNLARGGISESGASTAQPRGRPIAELSLGNVLVEP